MRIWIAIALGACGFARRLTGLQPAGSGPMYIVQLVPSGRGFETQWLAEPRCRTTTKLQGDPSERATCRCDG